MCKKIIECTVSKMYNSSILNTWFLNKTNCDRMHKTPIYFTNIKFKKKKETIILEKHN